MHGLPSTPPLLFVEAADADLAARAGQGDAAAFTVLVERHWGRWVRLARSVVGQAEAEDVVQDSLVVAWDRMGTLRDPAAFPGWVLRIVARRAIRVGRRWSWRRLMPVADLPERADPAGGAEAEALEVERVLRQLPARQRAVMHLTVVEGMSDGEIATVLGMDAATARSHRRKARVSLRRILGAAEAGGEEEP